MKRLLSLLLCLVFAFAFFGCGGETVTDSSVTEDSVAGVEYYHYDPADFNDSCKDLEKLASGEDADKVLSLYDELYDDCREMDSLYAVACIKHSIDQNDDYYTDEQQYTYDTLQDCADNFGGICRKITEGPCADAFREHVGDKVFKEFADYEIMSQEEKDMLSEENKLVDKYYKAYDNASYKYKDKKWTMADLFSEKGDKLQENDYSGYWEIYDGILKNLNEKAGPIFLDLLDLRIQIAEEEGYDNYADYADREIYSRDYSVKDLEQFHADVKKVSADYYDYYFASFVGDPKALTNEQILECLDTYSGKISKGAGKSCSTLLDENLYSIGSEAGRMDVGYTTYIDSVDKPFIFDCVTGSNGLRDMTHEFGHFYQFDKIKQSNIIVTEQNMDLAEIASNGFECLMTHYYGDIYGDDETDAVDHVIMDMFGNIIDGCMEDEFQRAIYDNPDMTLDEINKKYAEIEAEYIPGYEDDGYSWVFISHTFESPLYYVSYAASGIASLQIWDKSQTDFKAACKLWEKVVNDGSFDTKYMDVLDDAGMKKFTEDGAVEEICKPALKYLEDN